VSEISIVALQGVLDAQTVGALDAVIREAGQHLILNLRDVSFVDSAGLGTMLMASESLKRRGGEVVFSELPRPVKRIFTTLGLEAPLKWFEGDAEALAYFGGDDGMAGVTAKLIPLRPLGSAAADPPRDDDD
jgi:anti-anti-sigma factor